MSNVNRQFAKFYDRHHVRFSTISSGNHTVQKLFGYKRFSDNPPEEREGFAATFAGFAQDDTTIYREYDYEPIEEIAEQTSRNNQPTNEGTQP